MAVKKDEKELTFEEFLEKKKIDPETFNKEEPESYKELRDLFNQMHPKSFSMQKLFLINPIRRRYPLNTDPAASNKTTEKPAKKSSAAPVFKRPGKND